MYLLGFFLNAVYVAFRGFWLELLLVLGKREQAEEGVAGNKRWHGVANRRASKHRRGGRVINVILGLDGH